MADLVEQSELEVTFRGRNAFTVDVEDYFQVSAFEAYVDRNDWHKYECRLEPNMERILQLLDEAGVKGTFFFLGWMAERYTGLLRNVAGLGHEIASHGYQHVRVCDQQRDDFRRDVERTKKTLEDLAGVAVEGYRAASFSIEASNDWAREILAETGHRYSSSIFPIRHDRYGMSSAPRFACRQRQGVVELPVTTVQLAGVRLPCGGGGFFRLLPYAWSRWGIRRVNEVDGRPAIFYFHPWEIDPGQPRVHGLDARSRFRHYVNLAGFENKLRSLLKDFRWATVRETFGGLISGNSA